MPARRVPPLPIELGRDALEGFGEAARREWLCTNGLGGYAAGSVSLAATRRYHGLLVAALRPPGQRVLMVAKLELTASYGGTEWQLASNEFADGTIAPQGYRLLESFRLEGLIPVWTWLLGDLRLEQRIWMRHGANTTYVRFTRRGGSGPLRLSVDPLCTCRDHHSQLRGARASTVAPVSGGIWIQAYDGAPPYRILAAGVPPRIDPLWYWNFRHREETARGLDDLEDLLRPATFTLDLPDAASSAVVLTAEAAEPIPADGALAMARARELELVAHAGRDAPAEGCGIDDALTGRLVLAADQFLVERRDAAANPLGKTVIAGYPWFSDWGRDMLIALPGLALATGRPLVAASVLRTAARFVSQGMLPNRFPEGGEAPEYNTVDATLWYFVAVHEYLAASGDRDYAADVYPILRDMLDWHVRGTRFGIGMDAADGLLHAGGQGTQLTWMDARVGDWVVTPRVGKPVEINALWFNAVSLLGDLAQSLGLADDQASHAALAARIGTSFAAAFWNADGGFLYDVVDGPEGDADAAGRRRDASLRPNQLFALSLPYPLLDGERARRVLRTCTEQLWTPAGLRSLSPQDPRYRGHYGGDQASRDGAYHQGTVWPWLLGPIATAHYRLYADANAALGLLGDLRAHLGEACVGQVGEIMDGDGPFAPRGCFAQAWSVGEILRALRVITAAQPRHRGVSA
jgi:predicted glycogen debranching enzyme